MHRWMIFCDRFYEATPWPYASDWDDFLRSPGALENACADLTRVSPSDGAQELMVPADLPRPFAKGDYRFAIHHDARWLYVLLESRDAPAVVSWAGSASVLATVQMLSASGDFVLSFRGFRRSDGDECEAPTAGVSAAGYGPRRGVAVRREFDWTFDSRVVNGCELSCWRIARADVDDALQGDGLRLSISRTNLETIEGVSWGGYHLWGARPDEFGRVRLVRGGGGPRPPRLRRVDLFYDAVSEHGRLALHYENLPAKGEAVDALHPPGFTAPLDVCAVWVDDDVTRHPMGACIETHPIAWRDGHHRLAITSAGAAPVRFELEKRSGHHVLPSRLPAVVRLADDVLHRRILADCEAAIAEHHQRKARGEHERYAVSRSYRACGLAWAYHHFGRDPRMLEVVRDEADVMLGLQRADGSFAGNHMETRTGKKPTQPWAGGGYDSGPAGELWVLAAMVTGEEKYLRASRRLLEAWSMYRVEFNHNFAAIGLYHLASHYRLTGERLALEHALHHARHSVAVDFLPLGFQGGHNYYSVYGGLTLRGLARLAAVLPPGDAYRAELTELCVRMTNQFITRLQPDGLIDARDRFYAGQSLSGYQFWSSFLAVAELVPGEQAERIDAVFSQMAHFAGDRLGWCESEVIGYAARRAVRAGR